MATADSYGSGSIITPEAVLLDFELAGLGSRALAYAIDFTIQVIALLIFAFIMGAVGLASPILALIILLVGLILIVVGYPAAMETLYQGRTIGRMVVNTRVVTVEGAPVRFRHAFLRALLGIVDLLATAGAVAVATSLITKRGQRLGDLVGGTMVIREPRKTSQAGALTFWPPSYLADWSRTLDTQGLGSDVYQLLRDFLTRTDLDEGHRRAVAEDLAQLVSERLPHAARTPQVPAGDYLLAVATAAQGPVAAPPPPPSSGRPADRIPPPVGGPRSGLGVPPPPVSPAQVPASAPTGLPPGVPRAPVAPVRQTEAGPLPAPHPAPSESPGYVQPPDDGGFAAPG